MKRTFNGGRTGIGMRGVVLAAAAVLLLGGCAGKRPLHLVEESGDKAFKQRQFDRALADYLEYVDRRPGDGAVRHKLAVSLLETGQATKAVEHAWLAYDDKPTNDEYVETLARSMHESGKHEELGKFLRDEIERRGRIDDYLRLARYSSLMGDGDGAELAYLTAARLDGGRTLNLQLQIAKFYLSIGDKLSAYERFRMALFLDPDNDIAYREIRELGYIPGPSLAIPPKELRGAQATGTEP
ncbi:MAG: tetratricopeptide repeat protein [Phycisphaerales bacterium]